VSRPLQRRGDSLYLEDVPIARLAEEYDTPLYAYSRSALRDRALRFETAFGDAPHIVTYAIKANMNLAIAASFQKLGLGFDITSLGELERALRVGGDPSRIVYSGVGKRSEEIDRALESGIRMINVESLEELERIEERARATGTTASVAFRLNPDVDPKTHPYISTGLRTAKFGIPIEEAGEAYARAKALPHVRVVGVSCHIGSQITSIDPIRDAVTRLRDVVKTLRADGHEIEIIDAGGGLGVRYSDDDDPPSPEEYVGAIREILGDLGATLVVELGRSLVAEAGVFICRVLYRKVNGERRFVIVDGAMNDLLRPSLYQTEMHIETDPLRDGPVAPVDVVGPVCESTDRLAKDRPLPPVERGDRVVVRDAGAYGFCMASTYNGRPLAAEVWVEGDRVEVIRERQSISETWAGERIPGDKP
jgi:diaminopimelate decarboxylase